MLILRKTALQLFIFWKASLGLVKAMVSHFFADSISVSQRHTHSSYKAKEREALDDSSICLEGEQLMFTPLTLIPSRVWNPGFPIFEFSSWEANHTHCCLFLVQSVCNC